MCKFTRIFSLLLFAGFLSAAPAKAADKVNLILDWFLNPDHGPIIIAQEKGYFKDQGLEVAITAPSDPSDPPKMVAAGKADLAVSYQPQLHLQVQQGLPLKRVGTLIASPLNCLLVLDAGPIKSIKDLKGKKIGYSVAGVDESLLSAIFEKQGFTNKDVELINVNWSLSPALMSKQVDAVIGAYRNFELNQMDINGVKGKCFYLEEIGIPVYDELIYVAHSDKMDKAKISRFLKATELATQFIVNHPKESWAIFSKTKKELQDELNKRAWVDTIPRFALRPAALDRARYKNYEAFLKKVGQIKSENPVSKLAVDVNSD